jgi:hypothetical protein
MFVSFSSNGTDANSGTGTAYPSLVVEQELLTLRHSDIGHAIGHHGQQILTN